MLKAFKSYCIALLKWWWVVVIGIIFAAISAALTIWPETRIPVWVSISLFLIGLLVAGFFAYSELYLSMATYGQVEGILTRLADLRTKGVNLRNKGLSINQMNQVDGWVRSVEPWNEEVLTEIKKLSISEASLFKTADLVETITFAAVSSVHQTNVQYITNRLRKLENLIEGYSAQNLTRKLVKD